MPKETIIIYDGKQIASFYAGQTATIKTAETEVEHDIVVIAGGAKAEEVESTHALYNGVKLPTIPEDVLAQYPYCWIRNNTRTGFYDLLLSKDAWYLQNANTLAKSTNDTMWYQIAIVSADTATVWANNQTYSAMAWGNESDRRIMWSNHDIPNGSATSTDIYFEGTEPVPIEEEPEEPTNAIEITYNGEVIANLGAGQTATIKCANTELGHDIVVSAKEEEDDSIVGTWVFKDVITKDGLQEFYSSNGKEYMVYFTTNGYGYAKISYCNINNLDYLQISNRNGTGTYAYSWSGAYGENVWQSEKFKTWEITAEPTDVEFIAWLKANATKIS